MMTIPTSFLFLVVFSFGGQLVLTTLFVSRKALTLNFKLYCGTLLPQNLRLFILAFNRTKIFEFNLSPHWFFYDCVRDGYKVIHKVQYHLDFEGDWVYLLNNGNSFLETSVQELYMNTHFWEDKEIIVKLYDLLWEIYSLKSNTRGNLIGFICLFLTPCVLSLVNLNGFCHWLIEGNDIVSFDFSKETFFATTLHSLQLSSIFLVYNLF